MLKHDKLFYYLFIMKNHGFSMDDLGRKIKQARLRCGLTQEKVAELVGVSRTAVSKWESSESVPTIQNLILLSGLLHTSVDHLLGLDRKNRSITMTLTPEAVSLLEKFVNEAVSIR